MTDEAFPVGPTEVSRVISSVAGEHYAAVAPGPVAGRLAQLHMRAWDIVLIGASARDAFDELHRQVGRLVDAELTIADCDHRIIWALTPVIGATLACEPGVVAVRLREVYEALAGLLAAARAPADRVEAAARIAA